METFLGIVGGFTLFVLGASLLFCMWCLACACAKWAMEKAFWKLDAAFRHEFAGHIMRSSWWFSEDKKTMRALQLFAESVTTGMGSVDSVRKQWREEFPEVPDAQG